MKENITMKLKHGSLFLILYLAAVSLVPGETFGQTGPLRIDGFSPAAGQVGTTALTHAYAVYGKIELNDAKVSRAKQGFHEMEENNNEALLTPVPTPLQPKEEDKVYDSTYMDAYSILSANNSCSRFFGGASRAVEVLNMLSGRLQKQFFPDPKLAMIMSGEITLVINYTTGHSYRLFEKATLNSNGPFYNGRYFFMDRFVPNVGTFRPNTREARVAILLHELGHLMKGPDGNWLLPDDGGNKARSIKNTTTIEAKCGDQIRDLQRWRDRTRV